eukprot:378946-Rhodomonas_salina.1
MHAHASERGVCPHTPTHSALGSDVASGGGGAVLGPVCGAEDGCARQADHAHAGRAPRAMRARSVPDPRHAGLLAHKPWRLLHMHMRLAELRQCLALVFCVTCVGCAVRGALMSGG